MNSATDSGEKAGGESASKKRRQRKGPDIPTEEECLGAIAQVARLAAMGLLKPAQANAIRGSFKEILMYPPEEGQGKRARHFQWLMSLRCSSRIPRKLLSLLEPLLSQEQIDMILKNSDGGDA